MDAELRGLVADHVADLRRCAVLLDPVPQLAKTAAEIRKAADELEAALSVAQGQGFVMVPRVPTPEMLSLALSHVYGSPYWRKDARPIGEFLSGNTATESEMHNIAAHGRERVIAAYAAMLAAAPAQPDGVGK